MTSTAGPATSPAAEASSRRGRWVLRAPARDGLLSVLVVMLFVGVLFALVPRSNARPSHGVDAAAAAKRAAPRLGFEPALPQGLPLGWVVTGADVRDSGHGITTWHIGYVTADGHYASIEQALRVTPEWISIMDSGGVPRPSQVVDGTTWIQHYKDVREVTALIHQVQGRTTMVTSKGGGLPNATVLAAAVPASQR